MNLQNDYLTPEDIRSGRERIFKGYNSFYLCEPTYLSLPSPWKEQLEAECGHNCDKLNIIRTSKTPIGCPYGENKKVYVMEHDIVCICADKEFQWMMISDKRLKELGV